MLRYSSSPFTFHLIPSSPPPHHNLDPNDPKSNHVLWDGFGSLALVNKANDVDRALVIEVRPPSIVDSHVMREFAKDGRREGWWHLPGQYSVGEIGQANLLQAQVGRLASKRRLGRTERSTRFTIPAFRIRSTSS